MQVPAPKASFWGSVPKRVKLLVFTQILNQFAFGYFLVYLTVYLVEVNVINAAEAGLVLALETVVVIVAGIPIGILSDRTGRKKFLIFGNALLPPTVLIFALTHDFGLFLVAGSLAGLAEACALGSWNAIIADQTDLTNRDAAFSLSFIVSNVFISLGLALPLILPSIQGLFALGSDVVHSGALLVLGLCNVPVPLFIWYLVRDYKERIARPEKEEGTDDLRLLLKFSGMNGIIGLGAGLIIPLLGTWLLYKYAISDVYSGPFLALSTMTIAFAAIGSPRLSKRYGLFNAILMTAGSSTFFMLSLAFIPNVFLAGAAYLVRSSLMNMASPLLDSYVMGIIHPSRRGLGSAISAIVWRLPNGVTTALGGYILYLGITTGNTFYYDLPWIVASGLYALGIALIYFNFKDVKPKG